MTDQDQYKVNPTKEFVRDLKKAPNDVKERVRESLEQLVANPQARSLRLHPLAGIKKPTVWKIDVFPNKSWQIALVIKGKEITLLRLNTHKEIQRLHKARLLK